MRGYRTRGAVFLGLLLSTPVAGSGIGFAPALSFALAGQQPNGMVVAEFNGDGHQDIAVALSGGDGDSGHVSVMLGDGRGLFHQASYALAFNPRAIASGDFNRDGRLDIALIAGTHASGVVHILLGDGKGGLGSGARVVTPHSSSRTPGYPTALAVADLNGDGILDLAVLNSGTARGLTLHFGRGDGTFADGVVMAGMKNLDAQAVDVVDLNGDSILDLVVPQAAFFQGAVGDTAGGVALGGSQAVVSGDVDGDGNIDILVLGATVLKVWLGAGEGIFHLAGITILEGRPCCLRLGDFDRDGLPDVALGNRATGEVEVLIGKEHGLFGAPHIVALGFEPECLVVGDWNEDQRPDMAVIERNGSGTPYLAVLLQYDGWPLRPARLARAAALR